MPWGAAIGAAATLGSAAIQAGSAGSASNDEVAANQAAIAAVQGTQATNVSNITANEQPYTALGTQAVSQLAAGEAPGGQFSTNFSLADLTTDPGYQFDLQQGNQAVQRSAAAAGTLNSGGTLKSIANYTTGLASNELTNAYNRYTTDQNNQFTRLSNLAGIGQNATTAVNQADTNQANTVSNAQYGATVASGAAQAAGAVGVGNALSGGLTTLGTLAQTSGLFNGSSNSSSTPASAGEFPTSSTLASLTQNSNDSSFLGANPGSSTGIQF